MGRILIVQPSLPHYRLDFFDRLASRFGNRFTVYASKDDLGALADDKVPRPWARELGPIRPIGPGVNWQPGATKIQIANTDVLVVCGAPRTISTILLLFKAKSRGAKTVWWGHYWSSTSRRWRANIRVLIMQLADVLLFYTEKEVGQYRSVSGEARDKVFSLNNGINIDPINELRSPYLPQTRPRDLLFIGRLTSKSGIDLLLTALAEPICSKITLDVIGGGDDKLRLQTKCEALGLSARVRWHDPTTDENRIAKIANRCKAFVYTGSVGLSLIHAFSYGLPAIVHDNPVRQMPEYGALVEGVNGVTFAYENLNSLSTTIVELLEDDLRLTELSKGAAETTRNTFNTEDMVVRFENMINTIVLEK